MPNRLLTFLITLACAPFARATTNFDFTNPGTTTSTCNGVQADCQFVNQSFGPFGGLTLSVTAVANQLSTFDPLLGAPAAGINHVWWGTYSDDNLGTNGLTFCGSNECNGLGATNDGSGQAPLQGNGLTTSGALMDSLIFNLAAGGGLVADTVSVQLVGYNATLVCPGNGKGHNCPGGTGNDPDVVDVYVIYGGTAPGTDTLYSNVAVSAGGLVTFSSFVSPGTVISSFAIRSFDGSFMVTDLTGDAAPEPMSVALVGMGLLGLSILRRKKKA